MLEEGDVPYGEDWQVPAEVLAWAAAADEKRPWRTQIRERFAAEVQALRTGARVLELGSGPGFLAECVLQRCPTLESYTLLDFSPQMLALSRKRLGPFSAARFVEASFKSAEWVNQIEARVDCVVSMQAIHEVRHKRHVLPLYRQVHQVLAPGGRVLICDHLPFDDTPRSLALYMTEAEQHAALSASGFESVQTLLSINGLLLYSAERAGQSAVS